MKEQLELFENFLKQEEENIPDRFDVTEITPIEDEGKSTIALESANRLINKTKNLPSNKFLYTKKAGKSFQTYLLSKMKKQEKPYQLTTQGTLIPAHQSGVYLGICTN